MSQITYILSHLKLCVAVARYNFKWLNIQIEQLIRDLVVKSQQTLYHNIMYVLCLYHSKLELFT